MVVAAVFERDPSEPVKSERRAAFCHAYSQRALQLYFIDILMTSTFSVHKLSTVDDVVI